MLEITTISRSWRQNVFLFGMIASVQFVILSFGAMAFYHGGFSFSSDYLSSLGSTSISGESNLLSCITFNTGTFLLGISVILLFPAMLSFFPNDPKENFFSSAGSTFAIFSGIATCGVALTPGDIYLEPHLMFAPFALFFSLLMSFFYIIPLANTNDFSNRYAIIVAAYTILLVIALVLVYIFNIYIYFYVYAEVFMLFILSYRAWKLQKNLDQLPQRSTS